MEKNYKLSLKPFSRLLFREAIWAILTELILYSGLLGFSRVIVAPDLEILLLEALEFLLPCPNLVK